MQTILLAPFQVRQLRELGISVAVSVKAIPSDTKLILNDSEVDMHYWDVNVDHLKAIKGDSRVST